MAQLETTPRPSGDDLTALPWLKNLLPPDPDLDLPQELRLSQQIWRLTDHTLLRPDATLDDLRELCRIAVGTSVNLRSRPASLCVPSSWVTEVIRCLNGDWKFSIPICAVVGFPHGNGGAKLAETEMALYHGASEIDMVMNYGRLRGGDYDYVQADIMKVARECNSRSAKLKVILETSELNNEEIRKACEISLRAGAYFVKTSTGFSKSGASVEAVRLMREVVGNNFGVKASGGIATAEQAVAMLTAGANRLGASDKLRKDIFTSVSL